MFTVIFGRPGCPYCVRAKELAEYSAAKHLIPICISFDTDKK